MVEEGEGVLVVGAHKAAVFDEGEGGLVVPKKDADGDTFVGFALQKGSEFDADCFRNR